MTVTAFYACEGKGIDSLEQRELPLPQPGAGEALVRLRAATLNFRDLLFLKGILRGHTTESGYIPLSCGAGEVVAVGAGVTRVKPGQRVIPMFAPGWIDGERDQSNIGHLGARSDGVARTHGLFLAEGLTVTPDELSDFEAATLPCAALTAWNSLFAHRVTRPGDVVVLQGTGGVSIAALQMAKAAGAEVIITSSSDAKLNRARSLGADHTINYRTTPEWSAEVRRITNGRGANLLIDVVGADQLAQSEAALGNDAIIAAVGMLSIGGGFSWGKDARVPIIPIAVGNRNDFEAMLRGLQVNRIRPVIDRLFPLEQLSDALHTMERGDFFGKVGLIIE